MRFDLRLTLLLLVVATVASTAVGCGGGGGAAPATEQDTARASLSFQPQAPAGQRGYVEDARCAVCHAEAYRSWQGSDHQLAMQEAGEESVLADFNGETFQLDGITMTFFRRDGDFMVRTAGADGVMADYRVSYVFGVRPLQQYLVEMPGGRLQCLVASWDNEAGRWFDLYPDEHIPPGSPYHWTGLYQNWNLMCAECHSTDLRENYDEASDSYRTTWASINVGCQACHGPGSEHLAWAESGRDETGGNGLMVDFAAMQAAQQVDSCAPCHARRHRVSEEDGPGRPFLDDFMPALLEERVYHADGQILDEVYVYGSFIQSAMYREGVRCTDCHQPHSLQLTAPGDEVCTSCHSPQGDARFPGLRRATYDDADHHHHAPDSPGSACVACHMPARNYMVVDPRRDHSMRVPRPDLTSRLGTPNACNGCHENETSQWAAEAVTRWFGPQRAADPHFGEALAAGRAGDRDAVAALQAVFEDASLGAIVRATALGLLARSPQGVSALETGLQAEEALIRATAAREADGLPEQAMMDRLAPLLSDPVRAVRVAAAQTLASVPLTAFREDQRLAFQQAYGELKAALDADADTPGAHLNRGVLAAARGETEAAVAAYQRALEMDPGFLPARFNLSHLFNGEGRNQEAGAVLRQGIEHAPGEGELYYSLGLLLAEERHMQEAAVALATAAELLPERSRVRFNLGLVMQGLGRAAEAENALLAAHRLDGEDIHIIHALAILYAQNEEWSGALKFAELLVEMAPEQPAARHLLERIQEAQAAAAGT